MNVCQIVGQVADERVGVFSIVGVEYPGVVAAVPKTSADGPIEPLPFRHFDARADGLAIRTDGGEPEPGSIQGWQRPMNVAKKASDRMARMARDELAEGVCLSPKVSRSGRKR